MSKKTHDGCSASISRRRFLGGVGAAAVATGVPLGFLPRFAEAQRGGFVIREDRFGRMFPNLDPFFNENSSRLRAALQDIGKVGGILDARDQLGDGGEAAAVALIADPNLSLNNPNNPGMTAGSTFIGQFIDHDLTFDLTSRLAVVTEPTASPNERDPRFDLDSVYGGGPSDDPQLYEPSGSRFRRPTKLRIQNGGLFEDVPRDQEHAAIIADPRNDENMMISGLQAAVIKFHNNAVDLVRDQNRGLSSEELFERARRLTQWHYQWMVVHEFLPQFVGQATANDILRNGRRF
jgi:Animal haem peroxidase